MILALSFGERVVNHFARRCADHQYAELIGMLRVLHTTFPCLESRIR